MSAGVRRLAACSVAIVAIVVHLASLRNGFVYDDVPQVVENPWIRDPASLGEVLTSGAWSYAGTASNYYRPVMHVVYTIVYQAFGLNPAGFHLANLILHAAVCVLAFLASELLLSDSLVALGVALLFAVHPVHTEAVSWIGGVPDLAAALFCLAALVLHATAESGWRRAIAAALLLLGALSKEIALVFPAVLLAWDVARRRPLRIGHHAPYLLVIALYAGLRAHALGAVAPVRRHPELDAVGVAVNVLPLLADYARMLVVPARLTVFHAFAPVASVDARVLAGIAVVVATAIGTLLLWRRARGAWFALVVLVLPLLPALYIPGVGENPLAERYLYVPSLGFLWLVAFGAIAAMRRSQALRLPIAAACGIVVVLFSVQSAARQKVWRSDLTLWEEAVARSPGAPIAHYNLAAALAAQGRLEEAIAEYQAALRIQPSAVAFTSLAAVESQAGREDRAAAALRDAIAVDPRYAPAWNDLGVIALRAGRVEEAGAMFRRAVALDPGLAVARQNLELASRRLRARPTP